MRKTVFAPEILQQISGLTRDPLFYFLWAAASICAVLTFSWTFTALAIVIFALLGCALAVIDLRSYLLPDILVLLLLLAGLIFAPTALHLPWQAVFIGALVGFLFFLGIRWLTSLILRQEALGLGDVKLLGALGAWVGAINLPPLLLIACLLALPFSLLQRWRNPESPHIPFGPALLGGTFVVLLYPHLCWQLFFKIRESIQGLIL